MKKKVTCPAGIHLEDAGIKSDEGRQAALEQQPG